MTKAVLEYDLSDEGDAEAYQDANDATAMSCALWDIGSKLRDLEKYGYPATWKGPMDTIEEIRKIYYEILNERRLRRVGY